MDKEKEVVQAQQLLNWSCKDLFDAKKVRNVGDVSTLVCTGDEPVQSGGVYKLVFKGKQEYALKILKTIEDQDYKKSFEVAPYIAAKGDLRLVFARNGQETFQSVYKNFAVTSVLTKEDKEPVPPVGPAYFLPSYLSMGGVFVVFLCALVFSIYKSIKRFKKQNEFRKLILKARYADPFMDFNIEMRELAKERKFSMLFVDRMEETFRKFFFRIFNDSVFFDNHKLFIRSLKGLGAQPHEVRSFFVLQEEYKKFTELYTQTRGQAFDQKQEFFNLAKKTVSKLKRYVNQGAD